MLKTSLRLAWRGLSHLTRITLLLAVTLLFLGALALLGLRYWILPDIDRYHDEIASSVSTAIGMPVALGKIEADWNGLRPRLKFSDVRILDPQKRSETALALQSVEGVVSWRSLIRGGLRFYSLELDQPDLAVRRDARGELHVAGVQISGAPSGDNSLADWLLHQSFIVVNDAHITWLDEQHAAPPLEFNQLNLLIENNWRRHRFALSALPPAALSAQLDLRGNFSGRSFNDLEAWTGELYARLDYADVAAWRTWVPLPEGFKSGRGAVRAWLGFANGTMQQATADLALADVRTQLAKDVQPLDLRTLNGRVGWKQSERGIEVSTRQLSLRTEGVALPPTDFYLRLANLDDPQSGDGEIQANALQLETLASLTDFLPLGADLKAKLAEFNPQGKISGLRAKWQRENSGAAHYEVKAKFDQLSLKRAGKFPGFSGLSGELDGTDATGSMSLNTHKLTLDAPDLMPEPLDFDTLAGQLSWRAGKRGWEVKFSNVALANSDVAGVVFGSFQSVPNGRGVIDLNINLTRGEVAHANRYVPVVALDAATHDWLRTSLLGGKADEFHLRLKGNLDEFPFEGNKNGVFQVQAKIRGGELEYSRDWPRISDIAGELLIQGKKLEVTASSGVTQGESLRNIHVVIPDLQSADMRLHVRGEASGDTANGLEFIQKSPIRGYIDGFTDGMQIHGKGSLQLEVDAPLTGTNTPKVAGSYHFTDNDIDLGGNTPALYAANGDLLFTESSMQTKNFRAQILGGPATVSVQTEAGGMLKASVHGKSDMDAWRSKVAYPALSRLHGGSDWDASIELQKKQLNLVVTSNLAGLVSDLPAPLSKEAGENIPLRFEVKSPEADRDVITLQYGKVLNAKLLRRDEGGDRVVKRGVVNFGGGEGRLNRRGVWVTGDIPYLSLEGWGLLLPSGNKASGGAASLSLGGADLTMRKIAAYGHGVEDLHISARNQGGQIVAQLASKAVNGEVSWQPQNGGRLTAHLQNLVLGGSGGSGERQELRAWELASTDRDSSTEYPALNLTVDDLVWRGKQLGKLELLAQQHGSDWLLENMRLTNPDGVLSAEGKYHMASGGKQTQVKLKLEISNAGKILGRSGYPNGVKDGSGKLEAEFNWRGAPDDFNYSLLDGNLKLDTGKGQFLKIEPGIGKLLGILSLQALPRHITLDFTDVFSNGFAFDKISGTAQIRQGVLDTRDFRIDGSAAKVTMQGQIDLGRETQNLKVRVLPSVGDSVSVLAFAGGPLVGIGTLIVNKVLRDPLDKLVSFEYNVTGSWNNPQVTKLGQQQVNPQEQLTP